MKKIVCVYNLSHEHEKIIKALLNKSNIEVLELNEELLNQKIGCVVEYDGYVMEERPTISTSFDEELIFLANLSEAEVDQFADELKKHFRYQGVMALLTEHNRDWYFVDFLDEVMNDHRLFKAIDELRSEMKACENTDPERVSDLTLLNETLMTAFMTLKSQNYEEKQLRELSEQLRKLRQPTI